MVRAPKLEWPDLRKAMEQRDFYATTGITFLDYHVSRGKVSITLDTSDHSPGWSDAKHNPTLYRTTFIGKDGKVLKEDRTATPTYTLKSTDLYVRARVVDGVGKVAWTQPVFR